ncbi:hypothetical protein COCC4DRAFT_94411, partial [Bipolaris maydis ATCC 48331]
MIKWLVGLKHLIWSPQSPPSQLHHARAAIRDIRSNIWARTPGRGKMAEARSGTFYIAW